MAEKAKAAVKAYDISDVQAVYRYVRPSSWDDLVQWLRREEETNAQAKRITVDEARAMRQDCERLMQQGRPFPSTPEEFWRLATGR